MTHELDIFWILRAIVLLILVRGKHVSPHGPSILEVFLRRDYFPEREIDRGITHQDLGMSAVAYCTLNAVVMHST